MKHARTVGPDVLAKIVQGVADAVIDGMNTTQRLVVGAIAGVFALTPFGAWDTVVVEPEPLVAGQEIEVGPFEVTVVRAVATDELGYLSPAEGNRLLAVVVEVTNVGERPEFSSELTKIFPAPAGAGIVSVDERAPLPTILSAEDGTTIDIVNPGVGYRVALVWEQALSQAADDVTLDVAELTWIEEDTTFQLDDKRWFAYGEVLYRGQVSVETRVDA